MRTMYYTAYGLKIQSTVELPELLALNGAPSGGVDVQICCGSVPAALDNPVARGVFYQAQPGQFLLNLNNIARYFVVDGRTITIERAPAGQDDDLRVFLLGSVFAALLHQREMLVLHGSAIETSAGAVVFVGPSGAGKSTLAAAFARRGYPVLCDDVCAIKLDEQGVPMVYPAFPQLKLWADMLEQLEHEPGGLRRVRAQLEKFALPLAARFRSTPLPLAAVYGLGVHNRDHLQCEQLEQMKKFQLISNNTYRQHFLNGLGMRKTHFQQVAAVAKQTRIAQVIRPDHLCLLDELMELLITDAVNTETLSC